MEWSGAFAGHPGSQTQCGHLRELCPTSHTLGAAPPGHSSPRAGLRKEPGGPGKGGQGPCAPQRPRGRWPRAGNAGPLPAGCRLARETVARWSRDEEETGRGHGDIGPAQRPAQEELADHQAPLWVQGVPEATRAGRLVWSSSLRS